MKKDDLLRRSYASLLTEYPYAADFFAAMALREPTKENTPVGDWFCALDGFELEQTGLRAAALPAQFLLFMENMRKRYEAADTPVRSVTILGGHDKFGTPEQAEIRLCPGDVVSIVGPTGAGKSRLLADIEWLAQRDTPTGRAILINDVPPPADWRFSIERKLVAQLSQNMNFVMDVTVDEFIDMHMASRVLHADPEKKTRILEEANRLAGEPFDRTVPVTALSGGQSRALMIADTAYLSASPIILIDEIENAGIDRRTAVELLIRREKIVLMATHDPVLALSASRRIVIRNGGIARVLRTTEEERALQGELETLNARLMRFREALRRGEQLTAAR